MFDPVELSVIIFLGIVPAFLSPIGSKKGGPYDTSSGQYISQQKAFVVKIGWILFVAFVVAPGVSDVAHQLFASYPGYEWLIFGLVLIALYFMFGRKKATLISR
jgi:hypothetical protein